MPRPIVLASGSAIRHALLQNAGVEHEVLPVQVDEDAIKSSLLAEDAKPRDVADALAELKAEKAARKRPDALVIGCDQVLDFRGALLSKPRDPEDAIAQLSAMRGASHSLLSAAVVFEDGKPVWRHIGQVRLTMAQPSDAYLQSYVSRNWDSIRHSVGAYKLEEEGVRLFSAVTGDYFNVLGLPLMPLLSYLSLMGVIEA